MQGELFSITGLIEKANELDATLATLVYPEKAKVQRRIRDLQDAAKQRSTPIGPTRTGTIQCEGSVPVHRSTGSLRRDRELGYDQWRQCKSPANHRFFGWLSGAPRDEYLCERHSNEYLHPISWPLWISGCVSLRAKVCRKGHTWETFVIEPPVRAQDFLGFGDRVRVQYTGCDKCGEPLGYREVEVEKGVDTPVTV